VDAGDEVLPRVTPSMLTSADTRCARRLRAEFVGASGSGGPVPRARLREAFLEAARVAHAHGGSPRVDAMRPPASLEPEEQRVFAHAADWYGHWFGAQPVTTYLHDCDHPTVSRRYGVRVGGWVDLTVLGDDGIPELRQLDLWRGRPPREDPLELAAVWMAVLRLARWAGDQPLRVSWTDLLGGRHLEITVPVAERLPDLRDRLVGRLEVVRARAEDGTATPGRDCGSCSHVWRCPAHGDGVNVMARPGDIRPAVMPLNPTSLSTWTRCRRWWRNQYLLSIPPSDPSAPSEHGQYLHQMLRLLHEDGPCDDTARVAEVLDAHAAPTRLRDEVARHARRCPTSAGSVGHELELARFHGKPLPVFMATARLDALWEHDGLLDARDYKTGRVWYEQIAEDPRAQVQAWVLGPLAAARGLRLRLRYEHLAGEVTDDPEPWEPDAEELTEVGEQLHAAVVAMHAEETWAGVRDDAVCATCVYRSICPDSAAPGKPSWPGAGETEDASIDVAASRGVGAPNPIGTPGR
jgi:hypothetical protein